MFYIVSEPTCGGTAKFFRDIQINLQIQPVFLSSVQQIAVHSFSSNDIILYQKHDGGPELDKLLLSKLTLSRARLLIVVHDYWFLCQTISDSPHVPNFKTPMSALKQSFFRLAESVVFPSFYLQNYYSNFIQPAKNWKMVPHIDNVVFRNLRVPPIQNKTIVLGIITPLTLFKGKYVYLQMFRKNRSVLGFDIQYHLFGSSVLNMGNHVKHMGGYEEDNIYDKIQHIHGMLFLNQFPEMYSYALTKGINSGLPLLYTDFGAIKERLEVKNDPRYFPTDPANPIQFQQDLESFISFIGEHQGEGSWQKEFPMAIPSFYRKFFQ